MFLQRTRFSRRESDGVADRVDQPQVPIHLTQQHRPGVGGDGPAIEVGLNLLPPEPGKLHPIRDTVCHLQGLPACPKELCQSLR
jgi:hypothetical protein